MNSTATGPLRRHRRRRDRRRPRPGPDRPVRPLELVAIADLDAAKAAAMAAKYGVDESTADVDGLLRAAISTP